MKKIYILQKLRKVFQHSLLMLLLFSFFTGTINAQTLTNGNLSTGATTSTGVNAPAGFTWSEVQTGNTSFGFGANIGANLTIADDFTVTGTQPWNLTKFTAYGYSTGYAGTTSPFNDIRVQIFNTDPSVGSPTPVWGDLTTNRFAGSTTSSIYRAAAAGGTTRQIWKVEANVTATLAPGTYWIEWQLGTIAAGASNFTPPSTVVGTTTQPGNNSKQHDLTANTWITLNDAGSTTPQDQYFKIDYTSGLCMGTPAPGNTVASATSICAGLSVNLSVQNPTPGSGVTYQWQSSSTMAGPYTNIAGATSSTYSSAQTTATYYQVIVTCSGSSTTSNPVFVDMTPQANCYCAAGSTDVDPTFEKISNVTFGSLNNSSTSVAGYEDFSSLTPASFAAGSTANITVTGNGNTYAGDLVRVWIDFNQNGNFNDPGELAFASAASAGPYTGPITFPVSATTGVTKMRIRLYDGTFGNGNNTPCGNNTYGQVEDYLVNITPCVPGTISSQPVAVTSNCGGTVTFTVGAAGTGLRYEWQEKASATAPWTIVSNGGVYSGATTQTLTITGASSSMNGHQFQVAISGGCTPVFLSNAATLTVNPLIATVGTTLPIEKCSTSGPQAISITNASGATTTATFASAPALNIPIPDDGTVAGINNSINVATIPAGVNVVGVSVKVNITHSWAGDLILVLKAPNGKVINLDMALNATGGAGPTTGLVNTVISSTGTNVLGGAASATYTGTYAANLINTNQNLGAPYTSVAAGPTGYAPDALSWNELYSTPNGSWTLALYDYYQDDQLTNRLNNWSVDITYGSPATGIFTPSAGLFTDAAGLVPYTGTAVNTVYANPTATTTYSLVVTTPSCTSTALDIPVIVTDAVSGTSTATAGTACEGGTTTITSSAPTGGTVYNHQWFVSTDNGATYTAVSNGGGVSGATTGTLTLSNIAAGMNGNMYIDSIYVTSCNSYVISSAATLTVNPLPTTTLDAPLVTSLYPGLSSTISVTNPPAGATFQWYLNGLPVMGATGSSIVANVDGLGDYTVGVTLNGCTALSTNAITISSAPNDILFVYPSPNTGQFSVRYYVVPGNSIPRTVTIYDSKGSRVYSKTYNNSEPYSNMSVDMRNQGKGIFRVELSDRNGRRIKTGSVIIL